MRVYGIVLALLASISSTSAMATDMAPAWAGVWRGSIGALPVQACLQKNAFGTSQGAYFYLKHLRIIGLSPDKSQANTWEEDADHHWEQVAIEGDRLTGTWSGAGKQLPITLTRVAQIDPNSNPCGDLAFNKPRGVTPTVTKQRKAMGGIGYTALTVHVGAHFEQISISTFQLDGDTPAIRKINNRLGIHIPTEAEGADYFQCDLANLGSNGQDGQYAVDLTPVLLTRHWMVTRTAQGDSCGGAHPNYGEEWITWNLNEPEYVNLWRWLSPRVAKVTQVHGYDHIEITDSFHALLDEKWSRTDQDCKDMVSTEWNWQVRLTRSGFAFTPQFPHVGLACADDVHFSFKQMMPMLNKIGRANVAAFRADLAQK